MGCIHVIPVCGTAHNTPVALNKLYLAMVFRKQLCAGLRKFAFAIREQSIHYWECDGCLLQDKHAQKHHFAAAGVPVAPFADIDSESALQAAAADFGFPLMLKSKRCAQQTAHRTATAACN